MTRDTPRTDAALDSISAEDKVIYAYDPMVTLARALESELASALERLSVSERHAEAMAKWMEVYATGNVSGFKTLAAYRAWRKN